MRTEKMLSIRKSINQAMLSFILKTTLYDLEDVSFLIELPQKMMMEIFMGHAMPDKRVEMSLIKLYSIALDLHLTLMPDLG